VETPPLTDRTLAIIRAVLAHPGGDGFTATDMANATGIAAATVTSILSRLSGFGWLERVPGTAWSRPFQLTDDGARLARAALARPTEQPERVWTLRELEDEVAAGKAPHALLDAAREAVGTPREPAARPRQRPGRTVQSAQVVAKEPPREPVKELTKAPVKARARPRGPKPGDPFATPPTPLGYHMA
jgi:DNA-binding MarR family transcriptional regulator